MVVVLGDKETEIDDGHRLLQPRVQRSAREVGPGHERKPFHDSAAGRAEVRENTRDRAIVMPGFVRLAVLQIGRVQLRRALVVIIEPLLPQRFEVRQVSRIFLDGPLAFAPTREDFERQSAHEAGEAFWRTPQALQKFGSDIQVEAELKPAVKPAARRHPQKLRKAPRGNKAIAGFGGEGLCNRLKRVRLLFVPFESADFFDSGRAYFLREAMIILA